LNIFLLDKDLLHVVNNFQHKGSDITCMLVCLLSDQKVEELMQRYNLGFVYRHLSSNTQMKYEACET